MEDFKLPHRLVLLDHYGNENNVHVPRERMQSMVALAVLVESLQMGKTMIRDHELIMADETPTPHSIIDRVLKVVGSSPATHPLKDWPHELGLQIPIYTHVRDNLVDNQLLVRKKKKIVGIPAATFYILKDQNVAGQLLEYLKEAQENENMNLRDVANVIFLMNTPWKALADFQTNVQEFVAKISGQNNTAAAVARAAIKI